MLAVSPKPAPRREAEASVYVVLNPAVLKALPKNPKGDPLEVARMAGIMTAKRTAELIPMCHPWPLWHVVVALRVGENSVAIAEKVSITGGTAAASGSIRFA